MTDFFEIIVTGPGDARWEAEADSVEGAMLAARCGYDEVYEASVGGAAAKGRMDVYVLLNGCGAGHVSGRRP